MHFSDRRYPRLPFRPPPAGPSSGRLAKVIAGFFAVIFCRVCGANIRLPCDRALFSVHGDIVLAPNPPTLRAADLSLGLLFAVFIEELVFRKFLFAVIERWLPQQIPVIIISAASFALIHFTSGVVDTMVNAFVHGIFFGIAYWTTRRLSICVASHYLIDLLIFSSH